MRRLLTTLLTTTLLAGGVIQTQAQQMLGSTGLFNIPTGDMQPSGTINVGFNYIGEGMIDGDMNHPSYWRMEDNTGLYYITVTPFSWLEMTFRETLLYAPDEEVVTENTKWGYNRQDRSITLRVRPLKETEYCPGVVIGTNDPYSDEHNIYGTVYAVATKNLHTKKLASTWSFTVGYMYGLPDLSNYNGVIAGVKFVPDFLKQASLAVEYDTKGINAGVQACLFKHLNLYVFTREFKEISAGISYSYTINY